MGMERYDGKTKKDDYKKYALIALAVVVVIILYNVFTAVVQKLSHPDPDVVVIFGAETVTDFQEEDDMELFLKQFATDLDGNGKIVVDVVPYDIRENMELNTYGLKEVGAQDGSGSFGAHITSGNGLIFITHATDLLPEKYLEPLPDDLAGDSDYLLDITGCSMLTQQGLSRISFYAGIRKGAQGEEYETAVAMLKGILEE